MFRPQLETLESRALLNFGPLIVPQSLTAQTPGTIRHAYGFDKIPGLDTGKEYNSRAGAGQTIAFTGAYSDPNALANFHAFCKANGLPDKGFSEIDPVGAVGEDPQHLWNEEEMLDLCWAHAIAPQARLVWVAAPSPSGALLLSDVSYAVNHYHIVSCSWGAPDFPGSSNLDFFFQPFDPTYRTAICVAAGDSPQNFWPATTPSAFSERGTTLNTGPGGKYLGERLWQFSGTFGAVAYDSDPASGFPTPVDGHWLQFGGTSDAAPQWAALIALADQERLAHHEGYLATVDMKNDVKSVTHHAFHSGHGIPGAGSPVANVLVPALATAKPRPLVHEVHQSPTQPPVSVQPFSVSPFVTEFSR